MSGGKEELEEEEGNSTIYHVPSFLLKTYEIVDVCTTFGFSNFAYFYLGQKI